VRVRVVVALALAVVAGALALDMSGRSSRLAGTDHTDPVAFVATLQPGQHVCQPTMVLPGDAHSVQALVGTYGAPVPELTVRFLGAGNRQLTSGRVAAGTRQGEVTVPIAYPHGGAVEGTLCIASSGGKKIVIAGSAYNAGPTSEQIDGVAEPGRYSVTYLRGGRESWWQLLPTLTQRFGFGKASFFGAWLLPLAALLLLCVWIAVARLLVRELT